MMASILMKYKCSFFSGVGSERYFCLSQLCIAMQNIICILVFSFIRREAIHLIPSNRWQYDRESLICAKPSSAPFA